MTSPASWRLAWASITGTAHRTRGLPCQDAAEGRLLQTRAGDSVLAAVVADGAGSALHADIGAAHACTALLDRLTNHFDQDGRLAELDVAWFHAWITDWQAEIGRVAQAAGATRRDYACTLLAALVGSEEAVFAQVGDGAIIFADPHAAEPYRCASWPCRHEYANVTDLLTDDGAAEALCYLRHAGPIDELALLSDGLQGVALHLQQRTVHAPFFTRLFTALRPAAPGVNAEVNASLARLLDSPLLNDRTDDDKSLLLATRRSASGVGEGGTCA